MFKYFICRPDVDNDLKSLILRMLDKNPETRISLPEIKVRTTFILWKILLSLNVNSRHLRISEYYDGSKVCSFFCNHLYFFKFI